MLTQSDDALGMLRRAIAEGAWPAEPAYSGGAGSGGGLGRGPGHTSLLGAPGPPSGGGRAGGSGNRSLSLEGRAFSMLRLLAQPLSVPGAPHRLPLAVSLAEELCEATHATGPEAPRVSLACAWVGCQRTPPPPTTTTRFI
jgi:hypothetical protein